MQQVAQNHCDGLHYITISIEIVEKLILGGSLLQGFFAMIF